ncbi:MAG: DUF2207 domain-containing protein [Chloroflexi bacterium]|nr:DUF2207 domain-containing protein [Chloroflexota bacterium]
MSRKMALILLLVGLLLWPGTALGAKEYSADRFDVQAAVQADGSLLVTETVVFRFVGGPFTYVFRELPTGYTDGITEFTASMDGATMPPGQGAGQVEISGRHPIKVTWHFAPTSDSRHTFVLRYRMLGVIRQERDTDLLLWYALPTDYDYRIAASTIRVTFPRTATLLGAPEVRKGRATVETGAGQVTFTARDLKADSTLLVALRFPPGSLVEAPPQWQVRQAQAQQAVPGFLAAALAVLAAGAAGLVAFWTRQRREAAAFATSELSYTAPPSDLAPAIAGVLTSTGAQASWSQALGTLFELGRRGVLSIEESPERAWYRQHDFILQLKEQPTELRPHERGLLQMLFTDKEGLATSVKLSDFSGRLRSRWKQFSEPLKEEMQAAGFFSPERQQARNKLLIAGGVLLALAVVALAGAILLVEHFQAGPFLIPASLFLLSMAAFVLAGIFSPLSNQGAAEATRWKGFAQFLRDATKGREAVWGLEMFECYLPYAASFGLAVAWVKAFQKQGGLEIPAWFHSLAATPQQGMAAFVAMTSAAHSSGGGGAAGAGGGAAGGGGSGAG